MHARPPLIALIAATLAAAPVAKPGTQPASGGDLVSIGNDLVRFVAPPSTTWTLRQAAGASADVVAFVNANADSEVQFILAKPDFQIKPDTAGQFAAAIVKTLKDKRQHDGNTIVLPPTIEHDRRLDIVIHEKFVVGEAVEDQIHLYRSVGPWTLMVTASTVSTDLAAVADTFAAAKSSLASATYTRKAAGPKKAAAPAVR